MDDNALHFSSTDLVLFVALRLGIIAMLLQVYS